MPILSDRAILEIEAQIRSELIESDFKSMKGSGLSWEDAKKYALGLDQTSRMLLGHVVARADSEGISAVTQGMLERIGRAVSWLGGAKMGSLVYDAYKAAGDKNVVDALGASAREKIPSKKFFAGEYDFKNAEKVVDKKITPAVNDFGKSVEGGDIEGVKKAAKDACNAFAEMWTILKQKQVAAPLSKAAKVWS